jgi:adenylate kinase family enzyme
MKLHIFGASGSGVTTLGNALASKLGLAYFDSDDYFWQPSDPPYIQKRGQNERNQLIMNDLNEADSWILGGSILNWGDGLFSGFDLVIFLYLPKDVRMERLKKREFERFGDIIYTDPARIKKFADFMVWASDYDDNSGIANRTLQAHRQWLATISCPVLEILGDLTTSERMYRILGHLNKLP